MTEELKILLTDSVRQAVKETVNGKIDRIREDLIEHAKRDEENMKVIRTHMEETRPYLEAATGLKRVGDFIIYIRNVSLSLAGVAVVWYAFKNLLK